MPDVTVLMLARPDDPGLPYLERLPAEPHVVVAHTAQAYAILAAHGGRIRRAVGPHVRRVRWVHTRPAGVDRLLFPELVQSDVVMTNSRGVFSASLAEFALLGLLFFLKDVRRLTRNQAAGRWEIYEPGALRGRTVGIVGFGDIGRAVAAVVKPMGAR